MSGSSLLACGSRCITDTAAAHDWCVARLRHHVDAFNPTYVVHGGAAGVDTLADMLAAELGLVRVRYELDGWIYRNDVRVKPWDVPDVRAAFPGLARPLYRDRIMVLAVAKVTSPRACIAIKAPWSTTDGTGYTYRHAKAAGIATVLEVCPVEHGPRGGKS